MLTQTFNLGLSRSANAANTPHHTQNQPISLQSHPPCIDIFVFTQDSAWTWTISEG